MGIGKSYAVGPVVRQRVKTPKGAKLEIFQTEHLVEMVSVTDTVTVAAAIPAGAFDVKVAAYVATLIVMGGGGATWKLGVSGALDRWASGKAKTVGVVVDPRDYLAAEVAGLHDRIYVAATDILFTANAGTWTSGEVRLSVFYRLVTAPNR